MTLEQCRDFATRPFVESMSAANRLHTLLFLEHHTAPAPTAVKPAPPQTSELSLRHAKFGRFLSFLAHCWAH